MYDFHSKTLVLRRKTNRATAARTDVAASTLKDFSVWIVFIATATGKICENLEKSIKSLTFAVAGIFPLLSHWKQWIIGLLSIESFYGVNAALAFFQKYIQSTTLFFAPLLSVLFLPPHS